MRKAWEVTIYAEESEWIYNTELYLKEQIESVLLAHKFNKVEVSVRESFIPIEDENAS